jgi:hypothetical protein
MSSLIGGNNWDKTKDWFWEGNIAKRITKYMKENEGFRVVVAADSGVKEKGPDILAERLLDDGGRVRRRVEVKGYPSLYYAEGTKRGQLKRAARSTQARHWFAEVLLEAVLSVSNDKDLEIALGFPDFPVYRSLISRTTWLRTRIGLLCYIVNEDRKTRLLLPHEI